MELKKIAHCSLLERQGAEGSSAVAHLLQHDFSFTVTVFSLLDQGVRTELRGAFLPLAEEGFLKRLGVVMRTGDHLEAGEDKEGVMLGLVIRAGQLQ